MLLQSWLYVAFSSPIATLVTKMELFIFDWLLNRNTIEYLLESIYTPIFNYGEFAIIKVRQGGIAAWILPFFFHDFRYRKSFKRFLKSFPFFGLWPIHLSAYPDTLLSA